MAIQEKNKNHSDRFEKIYFSWIDNLRGGVSRVRFGGGIEYRCGIKIGM